MWCVVCKPNLVKCFGPRLRLWTWTLDFVPGPSFSLKHSGLFYFSLHIILEDLASSICSDDNQIKGQETEKFNPNAMGS